MQLNLPDILQAIHKHRLDIFLEHLIPADVPPLRPVMRKVAAALEQPSCQKFIFDSGEDGYNETNAAVRATALEMMGADLYHLPYPSIWIEDPFAEDRSRLYIFAAERDRHIFVMPFMEISQVPRTKAPKPLSSDYYDKLSEEVGGDLSGFRASMDLAATGLIDDLLFDPSAPKLPRFFFPGLVGVHPLDPESPYADRGWIEWASRPGHPTSLQGPACLERANILGAASYTVKKLLVTLAARGTVVEKSPPLPKGASRPSLPAKSRKYPFTLIRIPEEDPDPSDLREGHGGGGGKPRHKILVRGYVWGKNTRPRDQQRLIAPYWRGRDEVEDAVLADADTVPAAGRDHYEVR